MPHYTDTRRCVICRKKFSRIDFLRSFDRMVTCGNIKCAGERRRQRLRACYEKMKNHHPSRN